MASRDGSSSSCDTLARSRLHDSRHCRLSLVRRPRDLRDLATPRHRLLATSAPSSSIPIRHHRADATGCCRLHDHRRCAHTTQQDRQVDVGISRTTQSLKRTLLTPPKYHSKEIHISV